MDDKEYVVEAIRDRRSKNGRIQYLVKWEGWPETANTWEDEGNLSDGCQVLVAQYLEKLYKEQEQANKEKLLLAEIQKSEKKARKPVKVVGHSMSHDTVRFSVQLRNNTYEKFSLDRARRKFPDLLVDYLESISVFRVK